MNLDELALKVKGETYPDWNVNIDRYLQEFAHRLVAELAKQEPVAWRDDDGRIYTILPEFMKHKSGYSPLYAAPVIPAGWVMVPEEPTEKQWAEGKIMLEAMFDCGTSIDLGLIYKVMLQAAPKGEGK